MNDTQLQQYISAHNKQVELIDSLRKQIKELEERNEKEIDAVISAFTFINSEVQDYIDGNYKGSSAPQGVYVYLLNVVDVNGNSHTYNGKIVLIR
jgi:hypothetical protein